MSNVQTISFNKKKALSERERVRKLRHDAFVKLGGRCSNPDCRHVNADGTLGCTDWRLLQIDHVNGDGKIERIKFHYTRIYKMVVEDTEGRYRLYCANCHLLKTKEEGELSRHRKY